MLTWSYLHTESWGHILSVQAFWLNLMLDFFQQTCFFWFHRVFLCVAEILSVTLLATFWSCRFLHCNWMSAEKQVLYSSLTSIFTVVIPFILLSRYWERRKWEKEKQLFGDNRKMPFEFQHRAPDVKQPFVLAKGTQSVSRLFSGLGTCFACFVQIVWAYFRHKCLKTLTPDPYSSILTT